MEFQLNEYGYITNHLVSGRKEVPFSSKVSHKDQLACEKIMRKEAADHDIKMPEGEIRFGGIGPLGFPWEYAYTYGNWFVDQSAFYPLLTKIELHGATVLTAPEDMQVTAWLWSYGAVDVWVNGVHSGSIATPVYKPINREVLKLKLKKGDNFLFVRLKNLGVRDTRTLFGIQIPGAEKNMLGVTLPDMEHGKDQVDAGQWLSGLRIKAGRLLLSSEAPGKSFI